LSKILLIAGEASGDMYGAALLRELKKENSSFEFFGVGGDKMQSEGLNLLYHMKDLAFLGFAEVIKHLPFIRRVQNRLIDFVQRENIRTVVLIDYPGFNLRMAAKFKKSGIRVIYYIAPQIWAWGFNRIHKIRKYVDRMLVVFPFEEEIYQKYGVPSDYTGHPLIDRINAHNFISREEFCSNLGIDPAKKILALFPGSRVQEIKAILPAISVAAEKLRKELDIVPVVVFPAHIDEKIYKDIVPGFDLITAKNANYDLLYHSHLGIIKSGTSTLEASVIGNPFLVVYATSPLTYFIGKQLVKIKNLAMANIIAGENVVKEIIQEQLTSENVYSETKSVFLNTDEYERIKKGLRVIREKLGQGGASRSAAKIINRLIDAGE